MTGIGDTPWPDPVGKIFDMEGRCGMFGLCPETPLPKISSPAPVPTFGSDPDAHSIDDREHAGLLVSNSAPVTPTASAPRALGADHPQ